MGERCCWVPPGMGRADFSAGLQRHSLPSVLHTPGQSWLQNADICARSVRSSCHRGGWKHLGEGWSEPCRRRKVMWNRCWEPAEPLEGLRACAHVCKSFVASAGSRELPCCLPPRERAAPLRREPGCRARRSHVSQSCRKADSFAAKQMP